MTIQPRPDLSGLGNQEMGPVARENQLFIRPGAAAAVTGTQIDNALSLQQQAGANQNRNQPRGTPAKRQGWRR